MNKKFSTQAAFPTKVGTRRKTAAEKVADQRHTLLPPATPEDAYTIREGAKALKEIKRSKLFEQWLKIGRALRVGRTTCMNATGSNVDNGSRFNGAFGQWLHDNGLNGMHKSERSALKNVTANEAEVCRWRDGLDEHLKRSLNHPTRVWGHYQSFVKGPKPKSDTAKLHQQLKQMTDVDRGTREPSMEAELARTQEVIEEVTLTDSVEGNARKILQMIRNSGIVERAEITEHLRQVMISIARRLQDEENERAAEGAKRIN